MKSNTLIFSLLLIGAFIFSDLGFAERRSSRNETVDFFSFQIGGLYTFDSSVYAKNYAGRLSWTPTFEILPGWNLRFDFGLALMPSLSGAHRFFARLNYQAYFSIKLIDFLWFEFGAGLDDWKETRIGTGILGSSNFVFRWKSEIGIDRFYMGASKLIGEIGDYNEFHAGIGITIN